MEHKARNLPKAKTGKIRTYELIPEGYRIMIIKR
jgi:hypothetical protein